MKKKYSDVECIRLTLYNDNISLLEKREIYKVYLRELRKLAYKGNADAEFSLGVHYDGTNYWDEELVISKKKAFYWYSKAAKKNHPSACNNLASFYLSGICCKQNIEIALHLYETAIKSGGDEYMRDNYKSLLKEIEKGKYKL